MKPTACPAGTFRTQMEGKVVESCSSCPINTNTEVTGAVSDTSCLCDTGFYSTGKEDSTTCIECTEQMLCNKVGLTIGDIEAAPG